jgi:hypothetical protein
MNEHDPRVRYHQGYTLVDITKTDITQYSVELERMRNKQRNWETVNQILTLRTQLTNIKQFKTVKEDLINYEFGTAYKGIHRIWSFSFGVEFEDLYGKHDAPYKILEDDFLQIPIIAELDETVNLPSPLFYTSGPNKNIYFKTLV